MWAARNGHMDSVQMLIELKAEKEAKNVVRSFRRCDEARRRSLNCARSDVPCLVEYRALHFLRNGSDVSTLRSMVGRR